MHRESLALKRTKSHTYPVSQGNYRVAGDGCPFGAVLTKRPAPKSSLSRSRPAVNAHSGKDRDEGFGLPLRSLGCAGSFARNPARRNGESSPRAGPLLSPLPPQMQKRPHRGPSKMPVADDSSSATGTLNPSQPLPGKTSR